MKDLFLVEATQYHVLPLDDSNVERFDVANLPSLLDGRTRHVHLPRGHDAHPRGERSCTSRTGPWQIEAKVAIPTGGAEGLLFTQGGRFNGIGLYVLAGKPVFLYTGIPEPQTHPHCRVRGARTWRKYKPPWRSSPTRATASASPRPLRSVVDGKEVASGRVEKTIPLRLSLDETMDIGEDTGTPVSEDYKGKVRHEKGAPVHHAPAHRLRATPVAHEVRPAYLELRQTAADTFDVLWKVPALGDNMRLGLYVRLPETSENLAEPRGRFAADAYMSAGVSAMPRRSWARRSLSTDADDPHRCAGAYRTAGWDDAGGAAPADEPVIGRRSLTQRLGGGRDLFRARRRAHSAGDRSPVFVLGLLLLVDRRWTLLKTITAFTVAHSLTLALSTFAIIRSLSPHSMPPLR